MPMRLAGSLPPLATAVAMPTRFYGECLAQAYFFIGLPTTKAAIPTAPLRSERFSVRALPDRWAAPLGESAAA